MYTRRLGLLVLASAVVTAGPLFAAPASAAVRFDPDTKTGFIDAGDIRAAFGWTDAKLARRAAGLSFDQEFWTVDTYTASCGGAAFPLLYHRDFGRFGLGADVVRDRQHRQRGAAGYHRRPTGFRLTGARNGISGTSVPPAAGQPCPEDQGPNATIDQVAFVSTATGWALGVSSGDDRRQLLTSDAPAPRSRR